MHVFSIICGKISAREILVVEVSHIVSTTTRLENDRRP